MQQYENSNNVMESRDHKLLSVAKVKNGASPKSLMSRKNRLQRTFLFFAIFCVSVMSAFAQDVITLKNGTDVQALVQEDATS